MHSANAGERGEFARNFFATLRAAGVIAALLIAGTNGYVIVADAEVGAMPIIEYARHACTALLALALALFELHIPFIVRTAIGGVFTRSYAAKGLLLAYTGICSWNAEARARLVRASKPTRGREDGGAGRT